MCVCLLLLFYTYKHSGAENVQVPAPIATLSTPAKLDIFNHPDSDDPIAQTLFKMIEPDDRVRLIYVA